MKSGALGKVASVLAKGAEEPEEVDAEDSESSVSDLELKAVKAFDRATTPEDRALALRSFVKACKAGGY